MATAVAAPIAARRAPRPRLLGWPAAHPDLTLLLLVLLVGGLLRAAFLLRAPVFVIPDSENYFLPGFQLANGLGFDLEARRTPLYPGFIAAVVAVVGQDLAALALAQHLLGLATVGLTYALGRATFGRAAGVLAALLVGLNGSLLISEHTVTTEALFIPLLTLAGLVGVLALRAVTPEKAPPLAEAPERPGAPLPPDNGGFFGTPRYRGAGGLFRPGWLFLAAGTLLALAALARPTGLALLPGLPLALAFMRPGGQRWLQLCALYAAGAALVLLPWMVRNFLTIRVFSTEGAFGQTLVGRTVRHDRFVFVDPSAAPDPDARRQRARELMQETASRPNPVLTPLRRRLTQELGLSELQANQLMRDLAVEAILRQPGYYAAGTAGFFVRLALSWPERLRDAWQSRRDAEAREEWEAHPEIAGLLGPPTPLHERQFGRAEQLASLFQPARVGAPFLALFVIGLVAALVGRAARRPALLLGLWAVAIILVGVALVGPVLRYRYPAEPFLAVLASGGLVASVALLRKGIHRLAGGGTPVRSTAGSHPASQ